MIKTDIKTAKERKIWIDGFGNGILIIWFIILSGMFFRNVIKNIINLEPNLIIWVKIIGGILGILLAVFALLILIKFFKIANKKWK